VRGPSIRPTGIESPFHEHEIIVSKTDLKGRMTYANDTFLRVSGYSERALIGAPHSIIRHPDMPRAVFKLLWEQIEAGREIFAYVLNMAANGDHYWVFAHVTPSRDATDKITGYHSNRRKPDAAQVAKIEPVYRALLAEEQRHDDRKLGLARSVTLLQNELEKIGMPYDAFVFSV
jgi:PAS domain S-box-containing protein